MLTNPSLLTLLDLPVECSSTSGKHITDHSHSSIYSLSCMMPEMKNAMEEALNLSLRHSLEVLFLQASGLLCGLSLMLCMARFGGEISFG